MTVSRIAREDLDAIAEINGICSMESLDRAHLERFIFDSAYRTVFLKCSDGEIIAGYVGLIGVDGENTREIDSIAVLPEYRRRGIGRLLLEEAEQEAKSDGAESVFLEVRAGNTPALSLYSSMGYRSEYVRKNYYSSPAEDAVVMMKKL